MIQFDPKQKITPREKIKKRQEFLEIIHQGQRLETKYFVLYWRRRKDSLNRLGITVSKKMGKAVVRNRLKRIFREVFRKNKPLLENGLDIVINARKSAVYASSKEIEEAYKNALRWIIGGQTS